MHGSYKLEYEPVAKYGYHPHRVFDDLDDLTLFDIFADLALMKSMDMLETSRFSLLEECPRTVAAEAMISRIQA